MNFKKKFIWLALAAAFALPASAAKANKPAISVIPTPVQLTQNDGVYTLPRTIGVSVSNESLRPAAQYLCRVLSGAASASVSANAATAQIRLNLAGDVTKAGAYTMKVDKSGVNITAADYQGIINGIATLRQLLPAQVGDGNKTKVALTVPYVDVADAPKYGWRGILLDCSRHFYDVDEVKHLLDIMALYKLDLFHWHLVDDQGWRAEIKAFPKLTEEGGWRHFNHLDRMCFDRANNEHNPDMRPETKHMKINGTDTIYGGYYTQDDMREVVRYASELGISVMPEIDMPGHSYLVTLLYPETSCGRPHSSMCPGKDKTLEICKKIYDEILDIFPNKVIHVGGDEVDKSLWKTCPDCQKRIKDEELYDVDGLQAWFLRQMEVYFRSKGRKMIGWDEIAHDGLSSESQIMWWRGENWKVLSQATADGKKVTAVPTSCLYLDYGQDRNSIKKILDFNPVGMDLNERQQSLVQGIQGNIWCEFIASTARMEYMMLPRAMALSEIAWSEPDHKMNEDEFWNKHFATQAARLDAMGISYYAPSFKGLPSTVIFKKSFKVEPPTGVLPNYTVHYTTDGSIPTLKSPELKKDVVINKDCRFNVASFRPNGKMLEYQSTLFVRSDQLPAQNVNPTNNGLARKQYENKADKCETVDRGQLLNTTAVDAIELPADMAKNRALIFEGYLYAPEDGDYEIVLTSDDGSRLWIDDKLFTDNEGWHASKTVKATIEMLKGYHKVAVRYYDYQDNNGVLKATITNVATGKQVTYKH